MPSHVQEPVKGSTDYLSETNMKDQAMEALMLTSGLVYNFFLFIFFIE